MIDDIVKKFQETSEQVDDLLKQIDIIKQVGLDEALQIVQEKSREISVNEKIALLDKSIQRIDEIQTVFSLYVAYDSAYQTQSEDHIEYIKDLYDDDLNVVVIDTELIGFLANQNINATHVEKSKLKDEIYSNNIFVGYKIPKALYYQSKQYTIKKLKYENSDEILDACASIIYSLHAELWNKSIDEKEND